jgi:hypothetical protein
VRAFADLRESAREEGWVLEGGGGRGEGGAILVVERLCLLLSLLCLLCLLCLRALLPRALLP